MASTGPLVSVEWLAEHLGDPDVRVVDASWAIPKRNHYQEFISARIPGAVFFDIDEVADKSSGLPHMLPSAEVFATAVGALGISNSDRIVVYDSAGIFSAPRVWWTFRVFGADKVAVLDGGLPAWKSAGLSTESGPPSAPEERVFKVNLRPELVRDVEQVRANIDHRAAQVVDARPAGRFYGTDPEPRAGVRSGHIPNSLNVPFPNVLSSDRSKCLPPDQLSRVFADSGLDLSKPIITSCGSGVTASVLALAMYQAGNKDVAVYDGSWSEWGSRSDTPVDL